MAKFCFWTSSLLIVYIFFGYYLILALLNKFWGGNPNHSFPAGPFVPKVSTIVTVYNGEQDVEQRIENLLAMDYPADKHEIIIASDGSTDRTVALAKSFSSAQLQILDFPTNRGRALAHNDAVAAATGEVIIFTDVDTVFAPDFIKNITKHFVKPQIGCIDSNLIYRSGDTSIADAETFYLRLEKKLRGLESNLGILATTSGPAMAVRKKLWRPLMPTDDCDFIAPLDVIQQGYQVTLATDARAYDFAPASSMEGEIKVRIRMTSKNLVGTWRRWKLTSCLRHPLVTWGLVSHKILRWLTPFFMVGAFCSNLALLKTGPFYGFALALQLIFYSLAGLGFAAEFFKKNIPIPLVGIIFSFCVANVGMAMGVIKGLRGKAPATYQRVV